MKHFYKLLFAVGLFCAVSPQARAEIIWGQPSAMETHQNLNRQGDVMLNRTEISQLQRSLAARGFYKGGIDGLWGKRTTQALLDYQAVNEMPQSGIVTHQMMRDLNLHASRDCCPCR